MTAMITLLSENVGISLDLAILLLVVNIYVCFSFVSFLISLLLKSQILNLKCCSLNRECSQKVISKCRANECNLREVNDDALRAGCSSHDMGLSNVAEKRRDACLLSGCYAGYLWHVQTPASRAI